MGAMVERERSLARTFILSFSVGDCRGSPAAPCGQNWDRTRTRGRKPSRGPACT